MHVVIPAGTSSASPPAQEYEHTSDHLMTLVVLNDIPNKSIPKSTNVVVLGTALQSGCMLCL